MVYEAEQQSPRRLVALKIIRGGPLAGARAEKLFHCEIQALARLRHPGIAAIYESGRTASGQYFYSMALGSGQTLDAYLNLSALSSIFGGSYQSAQVGLAIDFTGRNRTAEAQLSQTAIAERRLKLEQARAEQQIEAQVRNSLQAIQTARQRITAAQASEAAAKEKLDSETRLYQSGESTNFFVLTRQNEYLDARRRVVVAQLEFNKAAARLEQAEGNTLSSHSIALK